MDTITICLQEEEIIETGFEGFEIPMVEVDLDFGRF